MHVTAEGSVPCQSVSQSVCRGLCRKLEVALRNDAETRASRAPGRAETLHRGGVDHPMSRPRRPHAIGPELWADNSLTEVTRSTWKKFTVVSRGHLWKAETVNSCSVGSSDRTVGGQCHPGGGGRRSRLDTRLSFEAEKPPCGDQNHQRPPGNYFCH